MVTAAKLFARFSLGDYGDSLLNAFNRHRRSERPPPDDAAAVQ